MLGLTQCAINCAPTNRASFENAGIYKRLCLESSIYRVRGNAADGSITFASWFSGADTPGNQAFIQNYSTKYGMEPDIYAAHMRQSIF